MSLHLSELICTAFKYCKCQSFTQRYLVNHDYQKVLTKVDEDKSSWMEHAIENEVMAKGEKENDMLWQQQ